MSRDGARVAFSVNADGYCRLYLQDRGGAERFQIYRLDRRTGRSELLTDGRSRHDAFCLSPDGKRLAFSGTGRNGRDTDVYVADLAKPPEARLLVEGEGTHAPVDFSPDGKRLLVRRYRSIDDADLLLLDVATGERRQLTPSQGRGPARAAAFSADGRSAYLVTDRYGDWNGLYRLDLGDPSSPRPMSRSIRWNVEDLAVSRDGARGAFSNPCRSLNERMRGAFDGQSKRFGRKYRIPTGAHDQCSAGTNILGFPGDDALRALDSDRVPDVKSFAFAFLLTMLMDCCHGTHLRKG